MKLRSIRVSNIFSFQKYDNIAECQKIEFDSNLNIIIGPNGSGKSNFVEIINQLFRNILILDCTFNEQNIENSRTNSSQYPLYQTLTLGQKIHKLKKNNKSSSEEKQIEIEIEISPHDHQNLSFIRTNLNDINRFLTIYAFHNVRPNFPNTVTENDIHSCNIITLYLQETGEESKFSTRLSSNDPTTQFVIEYFRFFNFIQAIIYIANKFERMNWPVLKNTFALLGGYRNYNQIDSKYIVDRARASKLSEILRKVAIENTTFSSNEEPAIFLYVKHKLSYIFNDIIEKHLAAKFNNSEMLTVQERLGQDPTFMHIDGLLQATLKLSLKIERTPESTEFVFNLVDKNNRAIEASELSSGEKGILHFIVSIYGYDLETWNNGY